MQGLRKMIRIVASDAKLSVLLIGEPGTGKELVAKAIHDMSPRRDKTLITVDCTTIARELAESELFGHMPGAFTGASNKSKLGKLSQGDGGTVFLDEIGELYLGIQPKLLRFLQFGELSPVGSSKAEHVDVRIIASTNRDLDDCAASGGFSPALLDRLNGCTINMPTLRERREDIPGLIWHFANKHGNGFKIQEIRPEVLDLLCEKPFYGNVRELEQCIKFAMVMIKYELQENGGNEGQNIRLDMRHINSFRFRNHHEATADSGSEVAKGVVEGFLSGHTDQGTVEGGATLSSIVRELEKTLILHALEAAWGNVTKAAKLLGTKRTTLAVKIRQLYLEDTAIRLRREKESAPGDRSASATVSP